MSERSAYSSELQCVYNGWRVLRDGELALDLPDGECCSMNGAIEIAKKIMPSVYRIETFSGGAKDTVYFWQGKKWVAA